jgi:hypothetical protein
MSVDKLRLLLLFLLYAAVSSAPCAILKNYVVGDGDNIGGRNNVTSTDECCALCQASSKCVAWNLHTSGVFKDECFLHGSADNSRYDTSSVSGLARGTFAPTPVPPPPPGIYETGFACNASNSSAYKFCDSSLSHEERLADLVPRIEDKRNWCSIDSPPITPHRTPRNPVLLLGHERHPRSAECSMPH